MRLRIEAPLLLDYCPPAAPRRPLQGLKCPEIARARKEPSDGSDTLNASVRFGRFELRPATRQLLVDGLPASLGARAFDVLHALVDRRQRLVTKNELLDIVWPGVVVEENNLQVQISTLRKLLGADAIETIAGRGYQFVAELEPAPVPSDQEADPGTISIAVLPFVNLAGDAADDYLVDGLTELMIANLARVSAMRVIARTSSMVYRQSHKRLRDIAAELGVVHIIEGSLRRDGGRIQVAVRLIDAPSETCEWTQTYTRELRDLLTLLNEIARAVARAVRARLLPPEALRLVRPVPIGDEALEHYLKGRYFWAQRSEDALRRASAEFAACARAAPDFAPAYGGLTDCQIVLALYGVEHPLRAAAIAKEHLARAFALDPDSAEVLATRGAVRLFFNRDFAGAERDFRRSLALNPSYTTTYLSYGDLHLLRADFEEALRLIHQAVKLSPFDLGLSMNVGDFLIFGRRFEEAARSLEGTLEMDGSFLPARLRLAEALALAGHGDAARAQAERAFAASPALARTREMRAFLHAATGDHGEARTEVARLESEREQRYVSAWPIARTYAVMGDGDNAMRWIEIGFEEGSPMMLFCGVHAAFDPVRADPRFAAILRSVGLPFAVH